MPAVPDLSILMPVYDEAPTVERALDAVLRAELGLDFELIVIDDGSTDGTERILRERYFISGEINSEVEDQEGKMEEIADRYSDGDVSHLDGVSVDHEDWHFNVRPSNTEPLLRLNLESVVSPEHMEERRDGLLALIRS